jgi:sugar lactone lactonase YvrE
MAQSAVRNAELLLDIRNQTGESPVWRAAENALYWVDIPARSIWRWRASSGQLRRWSTPEALSCLAPAAQAGVWLAGGERGLFWAVLGLDDEWSFLPDAAAPHAQPHMRFNDGKCDRQGRFIAGTMVWDGQPGAGAAAGAWYQRDGRAQTTDLRCLSTGWRKPNGLAFSPDGRTLYCSDSHPQERAIWACEYDIDSGTPGPLRPFLDMADFQGRPDGAAVDTDGCYWICGTDAGLVHRYTPDGVLDFSVRVASPRLGMCAFGGADLRTLYIVSARPDAVTDPAAQDGAVFALHLPDVQGLPEPDFAGRPPL